MIDFTEEYNFTFKRFNRPLQPKKLEALRKAIQKKNLNHLYPIIVDEDFSIIDGQHRFSVLKELNLGIWFIICNEFSSNDLISANQNQTQWKVNDYLHAFANIGRAAYQKLKDDIDRTKLSASIIFYITKGHTDLSQISKGALNYSDSDSERLDAFLAHLYPLAPYKFFKTFRFIRAFQRLLTHPQYSSPILASQIAKYGDKLKHRTGWAAYYADLFLVYNYNRNRFHHIYPDQEAIYLWNKS